MSDYYFLITDAGKALEVAAHASGEPVKLTEFSVGDGGGAPVTPDTAQTSLVNEVYRDVLSSLSVNPSDASVLEAECVIPSSSGGYTIREVGIFADDGTLYAVGNYPDQDKPAPDSGFAASLDIYAELAVSDTSDITLTVQDGSYLTEPQGDTLYLRQDKQFSEIADQGEEAQAESRENIGCGTAAAADLTEGAEDVTEGRALKVGDFGVGGVAVRHQVDSSNDLSSLPELTASGIREYVPSDGTAFLVGIGGISGTQPGLFSELLSPGDGVNGSKVAIRNKDGVFYLYNDKNKPTADDIGAIPSDILGSVENGGSMANANKEGWWKVIVTDPSNVGGFPKYADGSYLYGYGYLFVLIDGDNWLQFYFTHHGASARRQSWSGAPDTTTDWIVDYNEANRPSAEAVGAYSKSESDSRYVTKTQLGTRGSLTVDGNTTEAPAGCVLTGGGDFGAGDGGYFYRAMQYVINGTAHTAAYTATLQSSPSQHINIRESLSVDSIDQLINCQLYNNTFLTGDELEEGQSIASLLDEHGFDFYQAQSLLTGSVFIAYEPDTGIIRQIDTDTQLMWPIDMNLRGLDSLPDGCDIDGTWIYSDGEVTQSAELIRARNKRILASKLSLIAGFGVMFQLLPDDADPDEVQALKDYITGLRSADLDSSQPAWPSVPAFIL